MPGAARTEEGYAWPSLLANDGDDLFDHCRHCLEAMDQHKGALGVDVKGHADEDLLEKNAQETKSGAPASTSPRAR